MSKPETVIEFRKPVKIVEMACTVCGACANAACDCGAPYLPASKRAAEAIAANPEASDRVLAERAGVSAMAINRARKDPGVTDVTPDKRIGRDGKSYPAKPTRSEGMPTEEEADASWQKTIYDEACLLLERMADETRQRFFAHIRETYK